MPVNFSVRDVTYTPFPDGVKVVAVTDIPCTLMLRLSEALPRIHKKAVTRRGLRIADDVRFCFTVYEDNPQLEEYDSIIHTWWKPNWPWCKTKHFYFWGSVGPVISASTTCFFTYHSPGYQSKLKFFEKWTLAPVPPPTFVIKYIEPWTS